MERFNTAVSGTLVAFGAIGGMWAVVPWMAKQTSLTTAVAIVGVALTAVALIYIYMFAADVDSRINEVETKLDAGFGESLDALEDADPTNYPARADGGEWREVRDLDVEKMDFSGIPSVAGAGALGAFGAVFGPAGAAAGATIGALLGGGKEYQDLKEEHQKRLETAAWAAIKRETSVPGFQLNLEKVEDETRFTNDYWVFKFEEGIEGTHLVRISKNDGTVEYRPPEGRTSDHRDYDQG